MKPGLRVGDVAELSVQVQDEMKACFDGIEVHPLYSTAAMINHMEWAARHHILPYLETGEEGVGYEINVKHLQPTPIGATVQIRSVVTGITERRITSRVEAWNEAGKIGEGFIVQALVPVEKLQTAAVSLPVPPKGKSSSSTTASDVPSSAMLVAEDGQSFSLAVLRWENGMLPCTRYDEWLICRMTLRNATQQKPLNLEGPFLLRHEIEDWTAAMQAVLEGQRNAAYQSDFLESAIRLRMQKQDSNTIRAQFQLQAPSSAITSLPAELGAATTGLDMILNPTALDMFVRQLMTQLEGFPSRL